MVIQINNLAALERLLGGDTELEIKIRGSIIQQFAKKHLKDVAESEVFKATKADVERIVKAEYIENINSKWQTPYLKKTLKDTLANNIKSTMQEVVNELVNKVITEDVDYQKIRIDIVNQLKKQATWIADELTNSTLEHRLNTLVDKKILEKLNS